MQNSQWCALNSWVDETFTETGQDVLDVITSVVFFLKTLTCWLGMEVDLTRGLRSSPMQVPSSLRVWLVYVFNSEFEKVPSLTILLKGTPVIYVSFNYRLGPLGWPQGQEAQNRGVLNLGLKDQLTALEWVQLNIGIFGGDKDKVPV